MTSGTAIYVAVLAFSAVLSARLAGFAWRWRPTGGLGFPLLMLGVAIWSVAAFAECLLPSFAAKVWCSKILYLGVGLIAPAWFIFALTYSGRIERASSRDLRLLWLPSILTFVLALTNEWHGWVWTAIRPSAVNPERSCLVYEHGPVVWIIAVYSYGLLAAGAFMVIRSAWKAAPRYRAQARLLTVAGSLPCAVSLAYLMGFSPEPGMDPTPIGLAFSGLLIAWGVLRFDLLRLLPVAHTAIFEHMPDGALVLDTEGRVTDMNARAMEILGLAPETQHIAGLSLGGMALRLPAVSGDSLEYIMPDPVTGLRFRVTASALSGAANQRLGTFVLLRDITEQTRAEEETSRTSAILDAVRDAATRLLRSPRWTDAVPDVLRSLGEAADASRVYIFKGVRGGEDCTIGLQHEWCAPGIAAKASMPGMREARCSDFGMMPTMDSLVAGREVGGLTGAFPPPFRAAMEALGVRSLLMMPIAGPDGWWGLIGFDDCRRDRIWSPAEIGALRTAAETLGAAIAHERDETARREAEERMKMVLSQLPAAVWVANGNLTVETLIGTLPWSPSPIVPGRPVAEGPAAATPSVDILAAHQVALQGEPISFTVADTLAVHECHLRPRHGEGGRIDGVIGIALDVTARESARGEIRRLNDRLLLATRAAGIGIWEHDFIRNEAIWDPTMHIIYGVTRPDNPDAPLHWIDFVHPEDRTRVDRDLAAALAGGRPLAADFRIVRPGGEMRHLRTAAAIQRDGSGRPVRMIGVNWDITGIRRAERDMARLVKAIEQSADVTVITDPAGRIEYVNPAFERVTGYARGEVTGLRPSILKSGRHDPAFYQRLWDTISSGRTWTGRFVNRRKDGTIYEEDATISPVFDDTGRIVNYVAEKRDVTQERLLEAQLIQSQKMESIGRLAGGVAHDFNNCLQAILGFAELMLQSKPDTDPEREDLLQIQRAAKHAKDITGQLLSFSRRQMIQLKQIDVNALVRDEERMLRRVIGEDLTFELRLDPALPAVRADAGLLQQVLMNLVVNARDAMPTGGLLTISTFARQFAASDIAPGAETRPGRFAVITVSDTGTGIPEDVRVHMFEPFFTTKERGKGTGLGLAVVHGIIMQHEGWIHVYSEPGHGTEFKIFLPAAGSADAAAAMPETPPPPRGDGQRILLVEDEAGARMVAGRALRENGYTVVEAVDAAEAIRLFEQEHGRFALLASDVVLPDGNGLELAIRVQQTHPKVAVLLMSGYADERARWPEIRNRGYRFLQKPFAVGELLRAAAEVMEDAGTAP